MFAVHATTSCKIVKKFKIKNTFAFSKTLLLRNREIQYTAPLSLPFKVVPQTVDHGTALLTTLIRGGGGGKVEDQGSIIKGQLTYSVSSIFATRCSSKIVVKGHEV